MKPKDADGKTLHEGDRVYSYDLDSKRYYGTLHKNSDDTWFVVYDDGNECLVVEFSLIWKA